jgi:hypothetical protein
MRRMCDSAAGPRLSTPNRRTRAGRIRHVAARVAEAAAVVALLAVVALAARLAERPIYLQALHDRIAASLQDRVGDRYAIDLGPTYLMHDSWGMGLGFRRLTVRDAQGRVVVAAPAGKVDLDALALLVAQVKVRRLELDGLDMRLRVAPDGGLSFAVSGDAGAAPIALPAAATGLESLNLAALIRGGAEAMAGAGQAIDRLTLANGSFTIDNEAVGRRVTYRNFNLVFDRSDGRATARLSAFGTSGRWTIQAEAAVGDSPTLAIEAHGLSLADLAAFDKKPPPVFAEGPIDLKLDARLAPDKTVRSMTARFAVGAGQVRLNNPDALPFLVDEASGQVDWNDAAKRLQISNLLVLAGETHVTAAGWVSPPADPHGAWTMRLESKDARFGPERPGEKAVALDSIIADMRFLPLESRFIVDGVAAKGPTFDGEVKGEVAPDGAGMSLKVEIRINPSVTQDVIRLWPQFINPDVRDWASHNLHGGRIEGTMVANWSAADLDAMEHKRAVPRDSVHGTFSTRGVGVDLLPGLPMMTSEQASGKFTGRDFSVSGDRASMALSPTRRIFGENIVFTVPDTSPRPIVDAQAKAHLHGAADALADLLGREPLRRQAGLQIDPATIKGQAEGDLALDLKLGKTAKPQDTQFQATGKLVNLTLDKLIGEEKLDQGNFTFAADRNTLTMTGDGQVLGAPAHLDVSRAPGEEGSVTLALTLDQAARAKRGLNFGWLNGPLPVKFTAPLSRTSADVEIDLAPAAIDNPLPGVVKAAGKPGKATFQLKPAPNGATLSKLAVEFGTVLVRGSADIDVDGSFLDAKITQARISAGDDFRVDVVNGPDVVKAAIRGATFDARPFIKSLAEQTSTTQAGGKDFDVDLKIASVIGANKQSIAGLEFDFQRRGGDDRLTLLRGSIGKGKLGASLGGEGDLRLISTDAGALVKFADLYTRMEGGSLDLSLQTAGGASAGDAVVTDFALRDEPAFRRLAAAAPAGLGEAVDPTLVHFEKMTVDFARSPGKLKIEDAIIFNPNMGLTTQGNIDFAGGAIDVSGTFVPAYSLNTVLTKIPVVGVLLGGGQNEGVFGITYRVQGSLSRPEVTVNPLSAIAPGILRKLVSAMAGAAARTNAPNGALAAPAEPRRR